MATLKDLVSEVTQGTYFNDLMAKHKANKVPTASWLSIVNVGLSLTQLVAELLAELRSTVAQMAAAMFLDYAQGIGLTLLAKSAYQLDRQPATFTIGQMVLSSVAGAPSYTFAPGDITVGTPGPATSATRLYVNKTGGTLNPGGTLTLSFIATEPGAEGNIPPGSPLDLKTSFAGVSVTNPVIGLTGTWITAQGAPEEPDDRLKVRCVSRWSTKGTASNEDAYVYWAIQTPAGYTSSPVARVRVHADRYGGVIAGGAVTVVLAGPAGALGAMDVASVAANFENPLPHLDPPVELAKKYPLGTQIQVQSCVNLTVNVVGIVNVRRKANTSLAEVQAQVSAAMSEWLATIDIGQILYPQKIGARIEDANPTAIRDVVLTAPAAPTPTGIDDLPILNLGGLTYQFVD